MSLPELDDATAAEPASAPFAPRRLDQVVVRTPGADTPDLVGIVAGTGSGCFTVAFPDRRPIDVVAVDDEVGVEIDGRHGAFGGVCTVLEIRRFGSDRSIARLSDIRSVEPWQQRTYPRTQVELPCHLQHGAETFGVRTVDVSAGGLWVASTRSLQINQTLTVTLALGATFITALAEVVRLVDGEPPRYGLRFVWLGGREQILLAEHLRAFEEQRQAEAEAGIAEWLTLEGAPSLCEGEPAP